MGMALHHEYIDGIYTDYLLYQSSASRSSVVRIVYILIPGNPGCCEYYSSFCRDLYRNSGESIDIMCVSHAGHSANVDRTRRLYTLQQQVSHKREFIHHMLRLYGSDVQIVLAGHSVGAYICGQIMKSIPERNLLRVCMLFPTVMNIGSSPNGRRMRCMFAWPARFMLATMATLIAILPRCILRPLVNLWAAGADDAIHLSVYKTLSYYTVQNILYMAGTEMREILEIDPHLFHPSSSKVLVWYFGNDDGWVPRHYADHIIAKSPRAHVAHMEICSDNISHAFVVDGSARMADKTWAWIERALAEQQQQH